VAVRAEEDHIRVLGGPAFPDVQRALGEKLPKPLLVEVHERDTGARPDAELVKEWPRVRVFRHRLNGASRAEVRLGPRYAPAVSAGPLLVFGPRSWTYDFGPQHPLTPRRFGPGIDLLRAVGAEPGLAPEPASDSDLMRVHTQRYLSAVKRLSADPDGPAEAGIGRGGDDPAFAGMHDAAASVAGGSLGAVEAILRGDVEHAFHPGGGLHHAMPDRASGFCIYDDPALAIARARDAGLRVLYLDLDVHHGNGVQAIHAADPGVLTISFHESGRYLFPGTGFVNELGWGPAAGTVVNVPLEPGAGDNAWLAAVRGLVPALAAAFGPDLIVSQHGADSHAWDPLAHLRVTTTAMGDAARLIDRLAHGHAGGRWLATGGGGYDAYRVVPRTWSLVWLAGAHRAAPDETPPGWRARWAAEAARYGQSPPPSRFDDEPNAGDPFGVEQGRAEAASAETANLVREIVVPRLIREAEDRGWWRADTEGPVSSSGVLSGVSQGSESAPTILRNVDMSRLAGLRLGSHVIPPFHPAGGLAILAAAVGAGSRLTVALAGDRIVGVALLTGEPGGTWALAVVGVAPSNRRQGIGTALLRAALETVGADRVSATTGVAERDPHDPLPVETRTIIARRLFESGGFRISAAPGARGRADPAALVARRG
jgi:acetoin utilization protein AcuC